MPSDNTDIKIFAGATSINFVRKICSYLNTEMGKSETLTFSEGSTFVRILEKVRDKDVYIIQTVGMKPNDEFMELLFWVDAFKRASAGSITAIMPYFGYAKGDKKDEPRVSIRARVCADALESAGADRIVAMDLHSPQIQGFFKKPFDHLYGMKTLCGMVNSMNIGNLCVVSPDAGFTKRARKYAEALGAGFALGDKIRRDHNEAAEVHDLIGDVEGKNALITDDIAISCGTLVETAKILNERGASKIYACVTHAVLNEKGLKALEQSHIEKLIITDTVENTLAFSHPKIILASVAELFANAIKIIHYRDSLSTLFDE